MRFNKNLLAIGIILIAIVGIVAMPQAYKIITHSEVSETDKLLVTNVSSPSNTPEKTDVPAEERLPQDDSYKVSIFSSTSAKFNSIVDSEYPNLRRIDGSKNLLSNFVLVRNESKVPVHAFVVKWTTQEENERPTVVYSPFMLTPTPTHVLTGGVILSPNEARLISPWLSITKKQFVQMQGNGKGNEAIAMLLRSNVDPLHKSTKIIDGKIDGAVFADNRFVGDDESKLIDHFECERNGQHDEGFSIAHELKIGTSDEDIINKLNMHIARGQKLQGKNDRESLYFVARAAQAQMLLQILKNSNRDKLSQVIGKTLKFKRTSLER